MRNSFLRIIMIGLLPLMLLSMSACHKEKIVATGVPDFYVLPQGNQSYDDSIVAFHKKYGSYILYKFTDRDFKFDYVRNLNAAATVGNLAYVANTLQFIKTQYLNFYTESYLHQTLPFKILLAAAIDTVAANRPNGPLVRSYSGFYATSSMLAIGWTDSTLLQLSPSRFKEIRGYMHQAFAQQAALSGALTIPAEFMKYIPASYTTIDLDMGINGFTTDIRSVPIIERNVAWDFASFVGQITSHTKAELDATILSPSYDKLGLLNAKYNAVIQYYNQQGTDLQAIGELP
ncbi:MAG: hypothetical protein JO154_23295 [Chitinophaga sp.]|uniref:hypothetical protein n=1 Tax=Chitinophaga sp. TaxID=1869181 RepID=UPI0025BAA39C|nr:hypothetical protein [Chitinophaga sp.]MBV8255542.1 hypothetical protein [Chitinophaga sp.]